jgi:hypothetical protein
MLGAARLLLRWRAMRVTWIALLLIGCAHEPRSESDPPHIAPPPSLAPEPPAAPPAPSAPAGEWTITGSIETAADCPVFVSLSGSVQQAERIYYFEVPDGSYHLGAFADCNGNAIEDAGDLRYSGRSYTLKGRGTISLPIVIDQRL